MVVRWLFAAVAVLAVPVRLAHAEDRLVAVVRVATDDDAAVLARIEGQTSDLDVELVIERSDHDFDSLTNDGDMAAQLAEAHELAVRHDARVVVWFRRDADAWIVHVAEPAAERMLIRRIVTKRGRMAGSAAAEAAALVVRTALRALAAGGSIGVEEPEAPPPVVPPPAPVVLVPAAAPRNPLRPLRPYAELAWQGIIDGASPAGHHGVLARIGAAAGRWRLAVMGTYHPAVTFRRMDATIEVGRLSVGVVAGIDVLGHADASRPLHAVDWRVSTEVAMSVTRFGRTTVLTSGDVSATPPTATWGPTAGPQVRIARRVATGAWVELVMGLDLIAQAPEFGVGSGDSFVVHTRLWPVQPRAGLGLVVDMF